MKKTALLVLFFSWGLMTFAQSQGKPQWTKVISDQPETFRTHLISSTEKSIKVNVQVPGFYATTVTTPKGEANVITVPKSLSTAQAGEPDMPMTGLPLMIGDKARMSARVVEVQYMDFEGIEVAPSKGDFSRQIDPADVPYTYGECYNKDTFFPASNLRLHEPYIIRDFRGQNMAVYPFAYNPVTKTLRVYYDITVEMYKVDDKGENIIESRRSNEVKMDPDFKDMYQRHFLNYDTGIAKYTVLDEEGDLLIICYDNFISSMTDFVNWKKTRGINTTIVGTSTAGSTYSAILTYIKNQYNANSNLTHVLLVGDVAQIPGYTFTGGGSSWSGKGDNPYGQVAGNDIYNDVIIGRFSASSVAQVTTQVNRTINYERNLTTSDTWCQNGLGISTSAGSGGHNNEDDYQHIENLRTDLLNYGYTTVYQDYESVSGYPSSTTTTISNHINNGVGIINYCNHGEVTGWQSHYYMNSHVNALTNNNKLPFIFSVACLVGKYDYSSGDCFAETWMHATNGSNPTGAIGGMFSYISQPWIPPMWAQDEFVDIICELKANNIKRSFGGAAMNSLFYIFDNYSTTNESAVGTYQAWVLYGDPTLMLRTKTPQTMTVTHEGVLPLGVNTYTVNVSNGNGAVATITDADHNILGKATITNGTATISLSGNVNPEDILTLCVFGYNKVTYLGTITVVGGTQYDITVNQPLHGTISAPSQAYASATVTLTATPETGYCLSSWTVKAGNTNITVTDNTFTMPESDVTVTATFIPGMEITLASVMNGTISSDVTYALQGNTVNLTATPANGFNLDSWVVYKTGDVNTTVPVNGNSFTMPDYPVTVSAIFSKPAGGDVTIGSGTSTSNGNYVPTSVYYNYSLTQQIYTQAELGDAGTITAISFNYASSTASGTRTLNIYMSHTTSNTITAWSTVSSSQLVYSGSINFTQGWNTLTLTTPFAYNGTSNILITVDDNTGSYNGNYNFYTYSTNANRAIYYRSDTSNPTPTGTVSVTANTSTYNSQIKFTKETPSNDPYLSLSPISISNFSYPEEEGPSEAQVIAVIGRNIANQVSVTAPTHYEISSDDDAYFQTLTLTPSNGNIQVMVYARLKEGLTEGSYNDETLTFTSGTTTQQVNLSGEVTPGVGVNFYFITTTASPIEGGTVAGAGRYRENATATLVATPGIGYNFSQWNKEGSLVSTEATFSFTVTEDAEYEALFTINTYDIVVTAIPSAGGTVTGEGTYQHGDGCTLTATANTGYTFTEWTKNGAHVSSDATYSFTVTEAASYEAVFTLNTYEVTAIASPAEGGTISGVGAYGHGSSCTLVAQASEEYKFEHWEENGEVLGTATTYTFIVENDHSVTAVFTPVVHQTQSFNLGWGWISFYVNLNGQEGLQLLEQSFGEEGFMIKSQYSGFVQYNDGSWYGTLNSVEVEQMYQINASGSGTLTLSEVAVNPDDHPITINPGWNWIGYPCPTKEDVASAMSDFDAHQGDILKSHNGLSTYIDGYGWWGTLAKMNPGTGYMYQSTDTEDKTLVYAQGNRPVLTHTCDLSNTHWVADGSNYSDNATIIATIDAASFPMSENLEVGAFVDEECRGTTRMMYVEPLDRYLAFMTVYGHNEEQIQFRVYDGNSTYTMEEQITYKDNIVEGNVYHPVVLHQSTESDITLYPNPAGRGEQVYIELPEGISDVEIIDALGRILQHNALTSSNGVCIVNTNAMAPGFYTIHVTSGNGMASYKKLIIK